MTVDHISNMLRAGSEVWTSSEIALPGRHCFLPYYTSCPWDDAGNYWIFFSANEDFSRLWLHSYELKSATITEHCELVSRQNDPRNHDEALLALFLPAERAVLMPRGGELVRITLDSGSESVVYSHPESGCLLLCGAQDRNRSRFVYGAYRNAVNEPPLSVAVLIFDAYDFSLTHRVDLGRFNAGHFQFTARPDLLLYCHEGNTLGIDDRLMLLDVEKKHKRTLYAHTRHAETGQLLECVGHEFATSTVIGAVRYPDSPGLPGGLLIAELDGTVSFVDADDYWHCAGNADGSMFVMDTMWWGNATRKTPFRSDIILIDLVNGTKQIIHSIETEPARQCNHPHPQFSPDGESILFHQKPFGQMNRIGLLRRQRFMPEPPKETGST